jgi:predicted phage terminase large subunit-like protein
MKRAPFESSQHKRQANLELTQVQQLLALARTDLACYAVARWPQFSLAPHHELVVSKLEAVERGDISRLMLFLPPRHGKSLPTSTLFPAWYLGRHPDRHVVLATYGQELSDYFGRQVRNLVADPLHRTIFPACILSEDSTAAHRFGTSQGGSFFAVGRGGPLTGRGAHLLIVDDPLKDSQEASSETIRQGLHEWFTWVAYPRLAPGGAVILIQTRWHEDDLAGRLLADSTGNQWEVLNLPAIAESDEYFRRKGEALWPERYDLAALERIRSMVGDRVFASLYQQKPAAAEGAIFKRAWWNTYKPPLETPFVKVIQSWDTAFKTGAEHDYSVCTTWAVSANAYFLLHLWRGKAEFPEQKRMMTSLAEQWNPTEILIEDRASGQSLIQELKSSTLLPVISVKPDSDKQSRALATTPVIESGKVFLPENAPWVQDFLDEMSSFPNGLHDDIVDSVSQALNHLRQPNIQFTESMGRLMCGIREPEELDKDELWRKAMRGYPMTQEEIARM